MTAEETFGPDDLHKERDIGVGGFGSVIQLKHIRTGKLFAGKMINPKLMTPEAQTALEREIDLMRQFDSPYTVKYYGRVEYEGQVMLLMDFCDRGSIRDLMDFRDEVLSEEQIAFVLHDTLMALAEFHKRHNMVHRDIKAGNILFTSDCEIKITDFGVSRQFEANAATLSTTSVLGTPFWMAPEVILGEKSSFPCDIWSVGATAVEMAEGGPPYCEFAAPRAMAEISQKGFVGFRNDGCFTRDFTDFTYQCMTYDKTKRPTAEQLLQHPFIKQIELLDRKMVFEDLPMTEIDFSALLELGEEEDWNDGAMEEAPQEVPQEEVPQEGGLVSNKVPKVDVKRSEGMTGGGRKKKRILGYTTKFCKPVDPSSATDDVYKERAKQVFKNDKVPAAEPKAEPKVEEKQSSPPAAEKSTAVAGGGGAGAAISVIQNNPIIAVAIVLIILLGVKKGLIVAALIYGVLFMMKGSKQKKE